MKNTMTVTNVIKKDKSDTIKAVERDLLNIEKRLKELKELEKKLIAELEQF